MPKTGQVEFLNSDLIKFSFLVMLLASTSQTVLPFSFNFPLTSTPYLWCLQYHKLNVLVHKLRAFSEEHYSSPLILLTLLFVLSHQLMGRHKCVILNFRQLLNLK